MRILGIPPVLLPLVLFLVLRHTLRGPSFARDLDLGVDVAPTLDSCCG